MSAADMSNTAPPFHGSGVFNGRPVEAPPAAGSPRELHQPGRAYDVAAAALGVLLLVASGLKAHDLYAPGAAIATKSVVNPLGHADGLHPPRGHKNAFRMPVQ